MKQRQEENFAHETHENFFFLFLVSFVCFVGRKLSAKNCAAVDV